MRIDNKKIRRISTVLILFLMILLTSCERNDVDTLTYAVFPYIPQADYYQDIIEQRWKEIEPDIRLVRADWDCYYDDIPDGIDVIMYDAVVQDKLIEKGWIQPIENDVIQNVEDIFPFALEGLIVDDKLYGIPVLLCGNFLIYGQDFEDLAKAEHLTDFSEESEILLINSQTAFNRPQYAYEVFADMTHEANPSADLDTDELLALVDQLAVDAYEDENDMQVALAYDAGNAKGYIGYSESLRLLNRRSSNTGIKAISFADQDNLPRLYVDVVALNSKVKGKRYDKCIELMNVMAEADVLTSLSVQNGIPKYLMPGRKSPYESLVEKYPLYAQIEKLAADENNQVILGPRPQTDQ